RGGESRVPPGPGRDLGLLRRVVGGPAGDYSAAQRQADRIAQLLAPDANPRKLEPMHQLEGFIALYQGKYGEAAAQLRQGNPLDPYIKYQLAVATVGAGNVPQAKQVYREEATNYFYAVGFALVIHGLYHRDCI